MKRFILIMSTLLLLLMPVTVSAAKLDKLTIPVVIPIPVLYWN